MSIKEEPKIIGHGPKPYHELTEEERKSIIFTAARGSTKSRYTLIHILRLCGFSVEEIAALVNEDASDLEQ